MEGKLKNFSWFEIIPSQKDLSRKIGIIFFSSRVNSVSNKVTKLPVIHFIPKLQKNLSKV